MSKNKFLVLGVGVNDANYPVNKSLEGKRVICQFYNRWRHMLVRCYSEDYKNKNPTYSDCYVCDAWLVFSKFKSWMETQDWHGKQLDKDLLFIGNKVYSPETCIFVDSLTNSFINDYERGRGNFMIGVDFNKSTGKLRARCSNPFTGLNEHIGWFDNEYDAHIAWKKRKMQHAKAIAAYQTDARVAKSIIQKYS